MYCYYFSCLYDEIFLNVRLYFHLVLVCMSILTRVRKSCVSVRYSAKEQITSAKFRMNKARAP
jgi:hypothetical protein